MDESVAHWVGPVVRIGSLQRQRCMWCGAMIDETDLSRVAVQLQPGDPPMLSQDELAKRLGYWEAGAFVAVDKTSSVRFLVDHKGDDTPLNSCCRLDPAVTA